MPLALDQPALSAQEAAAINAAAVTRDYSVKPRLQYQTVSAVSGSLHPIKSSSSGPLIILDNVKVYIRKPNVTMCLCSGFSSLDSVK